MEALPSVFACPSAEACKRDERVAKSAAKKRKKPKRLEAVGWGFWLICFAVLYGPCWYLGYRYSYSAQRGGLFPWVVGFALAAIGAGLLSVAVNYALHKRIELERRRVRKRK